MRLIVDDCSPTATPSLPEKFSMEIPFKLDPFQAHAVNAIHRDENVLVTAKTGSGKTFVGEYQIAHSLARGGRVFYTTPIKSLSNQKFHDLKAMFPSVGIMTGDIKFRPDAAVVIMTTEILRNLLYKQSTATAGLGITASLSLDGLDAVVFDECHYINDRDRGRVWEETLILLPPAVKLVLLSATIDGPEAFGQWLAELKGRPVHLLSTQYRIVPLLHGILNDDGSVLPILTESETFQEKNYKGWLASLDSAADAQKQHRDAVADRRRGGYDAPVVKRKSGTTSYTHTLNKTIRRLEEDGNLPALFFVLSRADCAKYANLVEGSLLTSSDTASVEHILDFHLHRHMEFLQPLEQYHSLRRLLTRGIAYHHSGLVPLMKEIIELLFSKGFVKVLFATETFAVGINMPTKTVVFTSYRKYDDQVGGMRVFRTDEYIQMAGRAGRRGKDTRGIVLYLPAREPESVETVQAMMCGGKARIKSQMRFGFEFLLKVLHNPTIGFDTVFTNSYWNRQHQVYIRGLEQELSILRERLDSRQFSPADVKEMRELEHLKTELRGKTNKAQKVAQRALDQWRADHDGQRWKWLEEAWPAYVQLETDLASLEATYADALHEKDIILEQLADLEKLGFWDSASKTLTSLGQMATEVNEGHPILMPLIFQKGFLKELSPAGVLAVLAVFASDSDKEDTPALEDLEIPGVVQGAVRRVQALSDWYRCEYPIQEEFHVRIAMVEAVYQWMSGTALAEICAVCGIQEGNFLRVIMKMSNLLEEWRTLATLAGDLQELEKMRGAQDQLLRGLAVCESLYLRI